MSTKLFEETIFGPIISRRLGVSLGVNLLPTNCKACTFNCIYCECGYNEERTGNGKMPSRAEVYNLLESRLKGMSERGEELNVITFAGNGEPTLSPEFEGIMTDTATLRDRYFPQVKISLLSNATRTQNSGVFNAMQLVDNNILKLDSAIDSTFAIVNAPNSPQITVASVIEGLKRFNGNFILQTMFLRGMHNGVYIDNTTDVEVAAWIEAVKVIKPRSIMIYSLDRETPEKNLIKVTFDEMEVIANRVRALGFTVSVAK